MNHTVNLIFCPTCCNITTTHQKLLKDIIMKICRIVWVSTSVNHLSDEDDELETACHKTILWVSGLVCDHSLSFIHLRSDEPDLRWCSSPGYSNPLPGFVTRWLPACESHSTWLCRDLQRTADELLGNVWSDLCTIYYYNYYQGTNKHCIHPEYSSLEAGKPFPNLETQESETLDQSTVSLIFVVVLYV